MYNKLLTLLLLLLRYKYRRNDTVRSLATALTSARIQIVGAWSRLSFTSVHILLGSPPKRSNDGSAQVQQDGLLPGEHLPVPGSPVHPQQVKGSNVDDQFVKHHLRGRMNCHVLQLAQ